MADRRVGREQVLAFRGRRHSLAEKRERADLVDVVGSCGIQDTPPGNADVALAARLDLDGPVVADAVSAKELVLTWSLRGAPHLFPPGDLPVFTLGALPAEGTLEALWGQPEHALVEVERAMVEALPSPRTKAQVSGAVTKAVPAELAPYCRGCDVHHAHESVFRAAPLLGRIVLTRTAPVTLARAATWLGANATGDIGALRTELLLRYLRCYAPTTPGHFAEWVGIAKSDARARWAAVADIVVPVDAGKRAFVLEEDLDALLAAEPLRGVRLLPSKDVYLQARDRELLLPDKGDRTTVFTILGGPGVVLVDGEPAGVWRGSVKGKRYELRWRPFGRVAKGATVAMA
ncbi:MAG: winged helix DNA-binding domain-containing protein, partial [Actinomycetota bacterium]|nr:winged helix DNA-binding domain-containing protein [Actinomycetota bacterium]